MGAQVRVTTMEEEADATRRRAKSSEERQKGLAVHGVRVIGVIEAH
eukprot:CAMPEP_0185762182 /NCGR_PEP_ID=MMETSP1174-20130828/21142_1 /TAXON_ID=35687 /ORGANISM="Dictyocha speculum, Strain CCMP1381" /LENGTH=45 /DNA_ID= /DNA_START= /DNA_END= /DNA_ORIENTATION=